MNRRSEIALSPAEQQAFLASVRTITLSSIDAQGYPHTVAMWFTITDGLVHMTSFRKAQKIVNLRRNPKVALLAESGARYAELRGVMIRGRAELVDDVELCTRILIDIQSRYFGTPESETRVSLARQAPKRIVMRIHPERIASWDHSKLGGVY
jgi:PPOX class probable F420-dependent enzyme